MEIPVPNVIKDLSAMIKDSSKLRFTEVSEDLIKMIDSLHAEATRNIVEFALEHKKVGGEVISNKISSGYTLIRRYEKLGTGFDFVNDPIAPGCIVHVKQFRGRTDPDKSSDILKECYLWISGKRDSKNMPYVFRLWGDWVEQVKDLPFNQQKPFVMRIIWNNIEHESYKYIFQTDGEENDRLGGHKVIEVWRKGKSMPKRVKERSYYNSGKLVLNPQPI